MSKNQDRNLEAISRIDDEIVEWSSEKRTILKRAKKAKKSKKKWYIMGGSMAAAAAVILSTVLILVSVLSGGNPDPEPPILGGKQEPVYQGMTVSNTLSSGATAQYNSNNGNGNGNGDNGNHYGHYKGDYKQDQEIPEGEPFPDKPLSGSLTVLGGDDGYYAKPGEDIYITVHLSNPDKFEILSFTLNGEKYSSYMFEAGSDLENLILKVNVGQTEGVISYTIDAIKYVDGEAIKDVRMEGDQTIEVGVYTEKQPTVSVSGQTVGFNSVGFSVSGTDEMKLIESSNGKLEVLLYNGDTIVARKDITLAGGTVTFDDLAPNTLYQYAVVASYDALDGKGYSSYILEEQAFYTEAPLLFDGVTLSTTGISFVLDWHENANGTVQSIVLSDGVNEEQLDVTATAKDGLLPATDYTLTVTYKNGDRTEDIVLEFTTAPLTYTVTHQLEKLDGTYETVESVTDVIALGATLTPAVKTYEGFTSPTAQGVTGQTGAVLGINYYYERTTYTMTFVRNDGNDPDPLPLKYGHEIPGDTREGFGGWFRDETLTEAVTTVPAENVTLYAKWESATSPELLTYTGLETLTVTGLKEGVTLTELSIPSYIGGKRVTAIADRAFNDCTQLAEVTVPATVKQIGQNAFGGCNGLSALSVPFAGAAAGGNGATYFGYIFGASKAEDNNYYVPSSLKSVTVTGDCAVPDSAFVGCTWLESVTLGRGVTAVGASAFAGCTGLLTLNTADSVGLVSIGESAFSGCTGLVTLTIPENVTAVGASAFEGLTNLATINFNAIAMGDLVNDTFSAAGSAGAGIAVTFGANVTKVPKKLFAHFNAEGKSSPNIKSVSFVAGSVCKEICMDTFSNCVTLSSVTLPEGLEKINTGAFYNNDALTAITIPASVTEISSSVFGRCALLEMVSFGAGSQLKTLGNTVFTTCPVLKTIKLPDTLTSMGSSVFSGCALLDGVTLPTSLVSIGNNAFYNCTALSSIVIPMGVTSLGISVFRGCTALERVEIKGNIGTLKDESFYGCTALTTALLSGEITGIGKQAFYGCTLLSEVTLPAGLLTIGQEGFYKCSALTSITLPTTLTGIDKHGFYGAGLISVEIPASVTTLVGWNFMYCKALESITFKGNLITALNTSTFLGCEKLTTVNIPQSVESLAFGVFRQCTALESITIPAAVTSIGQNTFDGCTKLATLTFAEGSQLATVDSTAFTGCPIATATIPVVAATVIPKNVLATVTVINGTDLPANAFHDVSTLTSVSLPDGLLSIGDYAFQDCTALTGIELPSSLTSIGQCAFSGAGLTAVELPTAVSAIGAGAFQSTAIAEVTIPATVIALNANTFSGCAQLATVNLPATVKSFADGAFSDCAALARVNYSGTLVDWMGITFANATANPISTLGELYINNANVITETFTVPAEITGIGSYTFYGCSAITELNMHAGVTSVGANAFGGGVAPVKAVIHTSVISQISKTNLQYLEFNSGTTIAASACEDATQLKTVIIGETVTSIADLSFAGCTAIESMVIPFATYRFSNLFGYGSSYNIVPASLKTIEVLGGTEIAESAFAYCNNVVDIKLPVGIISIGEHAFVRCEALISLTVPEGVTSIGGSAFDCCSKLETIVLPSTLQQVGTDVYNQCNSLNRVEYKGTFADWLSITYDNYYNSNPCEKTKNLYIDGVNVLTGEVVIPDTVTRLEMCALCGCSGDVVIPASVTMINCMAFFQSTINSVRFESSEKWVEAYYTNNGIGVAKTTHTSVTAEQLTSYGDIGGEQWLIRQDKYDELTSTQ